MVGIECNVTNFTRHFKKVHTRNCSIKARFFFKYNSANKMTNSNIVDLLLLANS